MRQITGLIRQIVDIEIQGARYMLLEIFSFRVSPCSWQMPGRIKDNNIRGIKMLVWPTG